MKFPPFILLAALLFWGWQAHFLVVGAVMGVALELARLTKFRWELDDADFNRIWSFCTVLNFALIGYVFTNNDAGGGFRGGAAAALQSGQLTTSRFLCWLPMTMFAFVVAQAFNTRQSVPLTAISLVLRWRRRKGEKTFAGRYVNVLWPYFIVCIFSAGIQPNNGSRMYFAGMAALVMWALWTVRPQRYKFFAWAAAVGAVAVFGVFGVFSLHVAQRGAQSLTARMIDWLSKNRTDPDQSITSLGHIGLLKQSSRIMVWVEPQELGRAPEYLREASYAIYGARKSRWYSGQRDYEPLYSETNGTTWNLLPSKKNSEAVRITCYLSGVSTNEDRNPEGVLPLPSGSGRLDNCPAYGLRVSRLGTVIATGPGLLIFDAHYGPGASLDAPPDWKTTNHFDLNVPTNELPAIKQVVAELGLATNADNLAKQVAVQKFFLDKFTYSTWQGWDKKASPEASPLTRFLTTSRSGHCEYFACATVLMLRELGIPARYAVGYYVHETRGTGYVVRERDAHAWTLIWNEGTQTWDDFDTTPPSWVGVESGNKRFADFIANIKSWIGLQISKLRWRQANLQQYIVWALVPVLLVLLYHILFRRRGRMKRDDHNRHPAQIAWPGLDSEFFLLEKKLAALGLPRQPGESLSVWLERALAAPALIELREPLRELLQLHYRHRFDPLGLSVPEREELKRRAEQALVTISSAKP